MNTRRASILAASTLLSGVIGATAAFGGKAAPARPAPQPAAKPAPTPAPAPAPKPAPTNTPSNTTGGNPNNHYQRNPAPYDPYGSGYGYGYGDGNSGNTNGTKPNAPNNNNNNQPNPGPSASKSPSASSDSGGSGRSPATQPASVPVDPEVAAATAELNTAMTNLRATLSAQPDYAAALAEKQHASEEAAALHEAGSTSSGDISEIAARGLAASKTLSQIERTAMANDPEVVKAKAHLKEAVAGQGASAKSS